MAECRTAPGPSHVSDCVALPSRAGSIRSRFDNDVAHGVIRHPSRSRSAQCNPANCLSTLLTAVSDASQPGPQLARLPPRCWLLHSSPAKKSQRRCLQRRSPRSFGTTVVAYPPFGSGQFRRRRCRIRQLPPGIAGPLCQIVTPTAIPSARRARKSRNIFLLWQAFRTASYSVRCPQHQ